MGGVNILLSQEEQGEATERGFRTLAGPYSEEPHYYPTREDVALLLDQITHTRANLVELERQRETLDIGVRVLPPEEG